jgi:hypothetical protein
MVEKIILPVPLEILIPAAVVVVVGLTLEQALRAQQAALALSS